MDKSLFDQAVDTFLRYRGIAGSFVGLFLPSLKVLSVIISGALIYGIVYSVVKSRWLVTKYDEFADTIGAGDISRRRILRGWKRVLEGVEGASEKGWKQAIVEADTILAEILKFSGYRAEAIHDRLREVPPEALPNIAALIEAHKVREAIKEDPTFLLTKDKAKALIRECEAAFRELGLID